MRFVYPFRLTSRPGRGCLVLFLIAVLLPVGSAKDTPAKRPTNTEAPPFLGATEAARLSTRTLAPERFADSRVARAYRIAREIPTVLAQQPCYCWCKRFGHRSLLDCYVDDHAARCQICMKEAFLAADMKRKGRSIVEIREAIMRGEWRGY